MRLQRAQRADAAASTIKSLCHKWGAPALLDGVVVVVGAPEQGVADFAEEIEHERRALADEVCGLRARRERGPLSDAALQADLRSWRLSQSS